jgi:hypothetical protein
VSGDGIEQRDHALLHGVHLSLPNNTPDELRAAMLHVASEAGDVEECRELLGMLGLIRPEFRWQDSNRYGAGSRRRIELTEEREAS